MKDYKDIEAIAEDLNDKAIKDNFFIGTATEIDKKANTFVSNFSADNNLEAHTVSPSRWWFESKTHGIFNDGVIELYPFVNHSVQSFHQGDKHKETKFVAVNLEKAKLSKHINTTISELRKENALLRKQNDLLLGEKGASQ
jgi:hypothetical protein